jgi:DNA invertase Pin-like site-specific DNA recombinase
VVSLDPTVDMPTPNGRLVAKVLASLAEWESDIIGQRTADAMAEAKARRQWFGRERMVPVEVVERILGERPESATYSAVASGHDADSIRTPGGSARWYPSTVQRIVRSGPTSRLIRITWTRRRQSVRTDSGCLLAACGPRCGRLRTCSEPNHAHDSDSDALKSLLE